MNEQPKPPVKRRTFLSLATGAVVATMGALVAVPATIYAFAPLWGSRRHGTSSRFTKICAVKSLPLGQWRLVPFHMIQRNGWEKTESDHAIWARRDASGVQVSVLSPICPHLGCPIGWQEPRHEFVCPCHGSVFNNNGKYVSGPASRGMDPLKFHVRHGQLYVHWEEFKEGIPQRIPLSG